MAKIGVFKPTKVSQGVSAPLHPMHTLFCFRSTSRMQRKRRTIAFTSVLLMAPGSVRVLARAGNAPGRGAGESISLQRDDSCFAQPLRANLLHTDDGGAEFNLLWSRAPGRHEASCLQVPSFV